MERASNQEKSNERRFDRGSWVALAFALFVMVYNLSLGYVSWTTPTDGWIVDSQSSNGSDAQIIYQANVIGLPSDLRAGDRLTTVDGVPVADLMQASHQFYLQQAPNWEDGHSLKYTVLRGGQPVTLDVPIRRVGPVESMVAASRLDELQHGGVIRTVLQALSSLLFFLIGWYVFLMRPRERAAQALLLLGVAFFNQALFAVNGTTSLFYPFLSRSASTFLNYWTCIIIPSLIYLMLAFPRAKFPLDRFPRATVALLYLTWPILFLIAYLPNLNDFRAYQALSLPIAISGLPLLIPVLILFGVSFARERDFTMRAQYKWMTLGVMGFIGIGILGWLLGALVTGSNAVVGYMATLGWLLLPVSLAFAITRTRLFDIDVIVRRTLIYSTLTALLAVSYFGAVVILQQVFRGLTGQGDDLALILSTLAIAALSVPLRGRVQQAIDRRFYRRKYDAGCVLETFGARVRDEVDLNRLTGHLVQVVEETIQPESVSLWLRTTEDGRRGTKA